MRIGPGVLPHSLTLLESAFARGGFDFPFSLALCIRGTHGSGGLAKRTMRREEGNSQGGTHPWNGGT